MYDVIVIGAGPSGSATAATVAAGGARTLLIDRARFPRYKTCGGGIDGVTAQALKALGVSIEPVVEDVTREVTLAYLGRGRRTFPMPRPLARMTMRTELDHLLARTAADQGADLHDDEPIQWIEARNGHVRVTTRQGVYEGKVLVGADGVYSPIAKQFGLNRRPLFYVANEVELEAGSDAQESWQGKLLIDLSVWPLGYGWVFPKARHLSVGFGLPKQCAMQVKSLVERLRARLDLGGGRVISQRSHMLAFRRPGQAVVRDRVLVVGDAAGLVDPCTGAGIGWAIRSGMLAGETIGKYLRGEIDSLRPYQETVEATFGREIYYARIMRNAMMFRLILFGHRALGEDQFWADVFAAIRGELRYSDWYKRSWLPKWLRWTALIPL
ncbi:MAG TPA: NAD(P)/FAD-dependent oxidoreductase [Dehalococcoidia bacterium]|nr:NAD(P)/FAD-dependent oxidoreductase [Dehalococcoidia bacterium]